MNVAFGVVARTMSTQLLIEALRHNPRGSEATGDLLAFMVKAADADAAVLLCETDGEGLETLLSTDPRLGGLHWPPGIGVMARRRIIDDLSTSSFAVALPGPVRMFRSLLAVSIPVADEPDLALVLLSRQPARFSDRDHAALSWMVCGIHAPGPPGAALSPLMAISATTEETLERLAQRQVQLIDLSAALLAATGDELDGVIDQTLAELGQLVEVDRCSLFQFFPGEVMTNTHEWVAPGIAPMIEAMQNLPIDALGEGRNLLAQGAPYFIRDVEKLPEDAPLRAILHRKSVIGGLAAPILRDKALVGYLALDCVRRIPWFADPDRRLIQSLANALGAALYRRQLEAKARAAQAELQSERDRLRATLDAVPDLLLEVDDQGRFVEFLSGGGTQPAFPPETFLNKLVEEVLPPQVAAVARGMMHRMDTDGHCDPVDYSMSIDGVEHWFTATIGARRGSGRNRGYVFIVRDITKRYLALRAARRYAQIAALTSNYVVVSSLDGGIEWVNPAFERRTGWSLDEIRGKKPWEVVLAPTNDTKTVVVLQGARARGEAARGELLNLTRSGEEFWTNIDMQPFHDEKGEVDGFVSVHTDITHLKRSYERELILRAAAMEAASDAIVICSPDGPCIYMNPAYREVLGIPPETRLETIHWADMVHPDDIDAFRARIDPVLDVERKWQGEVQGLHRDGSKMEFDVTITMTQDDHIVCVARDITRRKRIEAERNRLRENLQEAQKREALSHVASGIAHDLNNLVAVVAGTIGLIQTRDDLDEDMNGNLRRMNRALDAVNDLVRRLGRLERHQAPRESLDLRLLVLEGIDLLGPDRIHKHSVHADLPAEAHLVWANRTEILQVIVNLALNACEAETVKPNRVTLSVAEDQSNLPTSDPDVGILVDEMPYTVFRVRDNGGGVPAAVRPRLFERYMTTKGAAGTGLGLPIVASILRDYGGVLWFETVEGQGSCVTVAVPSDRHDPKAKAKTGPEDADAAILQGARILVVDDNADVADVMSMILEAEGAVAIAISDPHEARQLIRSEPGMWAALVTDFDMPGLNGAQLAHDAMRADPGLPCVLVTALPESSGWDRDLFLSVQAKPLNRITFLRAVRKAVRKGGRAG